ncbi:MAG: M14 family zinc carboxypeptidase [Methanophagales archaeon]|nr:M14 family zinc carboxypeptidase [Methanophagales archaeon]
MKKILRIAIIGLLLLIVNALLISSAIGNFNEQPVDKRVVKVSIENQDDVDTLSNLGLEIYVIEQNYLAIRITNEEEQEIERIGFSVTPIKEDELVHRIVKVVIKNEEDINELANLGLDIWEVNQGYLIAMAYDKHIIELKEKGFVVEILYKSEKDFQKSRFEPLQATSGVSYHSYSSLKTELQNLENNYTNIAKVYDIGDSWEKTQGIADRDILAIKISDNVTNEEGDEPDVLFMGGTHAREWISVEVPFYLAKYLVEHYSTDQKVKQLVDSREIWIVPLVNPDGLEYSRTDDRLWRKNRRDNGDGTFGVDPNRNFGYKWGRQGSSGDSASNTYRGTAPFSEPETQAIRKLVSTHNFSSSISYHSYSQLVLYPWGYTKDAPPHKTLLSKMAEDMATEIKKVHVKNYTHEQASDLYITSGDSDDWLYGVHNIAAFTIELRPKTLAEGGFVLPPNQIIPTWEENKPAALYLIEWFQQLDIKSSPIASFSYYPENPIINETITFNASNSTDPDGTIENYEWTFGDGEKAEGEIVTHSYSSAGNYTVKLTVTDNEGAKNSTAEIINIEIPIVTTVLVRATEASEGGNFTATVNVDNVTDLSTYLFSLPKNLISFYIANPRNIHIEKRKEKL